VTLIQIGTQKLTLPPDLAPEMVLDVQDLLLVQQQKHSADKSTQQQTLDLYTNRIRSSQGRGLPLDLKHRRVLLQRSIQQAQSSSSCSASNSNNNNNNRARSLSIASQDARGDDAASLDASTVLVPDDDTNTTQRAAVLALLSHFTGATTKISIPHNLAPEMLHNCPLERLSELTVPQQSLLLAAYTQKFLSVAEKNSAIWNTPKFQRALFGASVEQAAASPAAAQEHLDSSATSTTKPTPTAVLPS